jgi:hypothetical protein
MNRTFRTFSKVRLNILLPLLIFSLAGCHHPQFSRSDHQSSGTGLARFHGIMLWDKAPIKRAALFLQPVVPGQGRAREFEFLTRSDGRFDENIPPGRYLLRSSPTTMCPVNGEVLLVPGDNHYRLSVHALSFLTCVPGSIKRL